jgi:hypothetical protein
MKSLSNERDNPIIKFLEVVMFKKILNWLVFLVSGKGELADEAIEAGILSYEGQGRDKYGK